jgi:hypothetical protein
MQVEKKYEQWRAITESDFVTLFIKTWFTFIAVLRELNPNVKVFTEDGLPRGDKPFLNAYKESIMPIVQKSIPADFMSQELFQMYPVSMKKVMEVFPQYFFQTFFRVNESFNYSEKIVEKDNDGKVKERYQVDLNIVSRYKLKLRLGVSGYVRSKSYNEEIKKEIDLRPIIKLVVIKHRDKSTIINEIQFIHDFYDLVMNEIDSGLHKYIENKLPQKSYNKTINLKIQNACLRLNSTLRMKFEYNYKYPHEINVLDDLNSYAIIEQLPFNSFGRIERDNIYSSHKDDYSQLITTKAIDWFASYVYSLRNALFHEIISPLDEEWQIIFKSAYSMLKLISDICITCIAGIENIAKNQENAIFEYVKNHENELFASLADYVELLNFSEMHLLNWEIDKGEIHLSGWFKVKLKLQNGTSIDIEKGMSTISEEEKEYDFSASLDESFHLLKDMEGNELINIKLKREFEISKVNRNFELFAYTN